jgi:hypothetical protein
MANSSRNWHFDDAQFYFYNFGSSISAEVPSISILNQELRGYKYASYPGFGGLSGFLLMMGCSQGKSTLSLGTTDHVSFLYYWAIEV